MNEELVALARRQNELLTVIAKAAVADKLASELAAPKARKLYELTGGALPVKEISKKVGLGAGSISRLWQRWEQLGLLIKDGKRYRKAVD